MALYLNSPGRDIKRHELIRVWSSLVQNRRGERKGRAHSGHQVCGLWNSH